jgi:hypothetical protein
VTLWAVPRITTSSKPAGRNCRWWSGSIGMDFPHIGNTSYRAHVCDGVLQQPHSVDLRHRTLAALAGEDRAALSGRPRKANAGQYTGVMPAIEVSSAVPRPLRCARDPRTRTAALHKVPLSLGRNCSSGWHPRGVRPTAGLLSFTRRLPRIPCSLRGLEHGRRVHTRDWNPFPWPQAPERTGPRSAAVLVRRMRASTQP